MGKLIYKKLDATSFFFFGKQWSYGGCGGTSLLVLDAVAVNDYLLVLL